MNCPNCKKPIPEPDVVDGIIYYVCGNCGECLSPDDDTVAEESDGRLEHATLDLSEVMSEQDLHRAFISQLKFPIYYGQNWAAFWDVVTDAGLPTKLTVKNSAEFRQRFPTLANHFENQIKKASDMYSWLDTEIEWK